MGLICVNETSIPAYLTALSGNVSDKTSMPEMAKLYLEQFSAKEETPILVADSAMYGADNLQQLSEVKWVTRVPITLNEAKSLVAESNQDMMQASEREGYFYHEVGSGYGGIEQRWLVVLYEPRREQELAQLQKKIGREANKLTKALNKLKREAFNCKEDAQKALDDFPKQWSFHLVTGEIYDVMRFTQRGRPNAGSPTVTEWKIEAEFGPNDEAITQPDQFLGKYLIATNALDHEKLPTEALLPVYKDQHRSVERGFRFLKDPLFFASRFFLKKPSRIMALLMIMGLSLLIYALAEHELREQLQTQEQFIPDQKGKPTQRPTMRRVFQMFEGIHILLIENDGVRKQMVLNVQEIHRQIASLLGEPILKYYTYPRK
jgi:transposase